MRIFAAWCGEPLVTLEAPPASPVVSVSDAKAALRITHDDEDALIGALVAAATQHLEGYGGVIKRALVTQSWRVAVSDADGYGRFFAPLAPCIECTAIEYFAPDALTKSTATLDNFRLIKGPDWAYLEPLPGQSWPSLDDRPDALQAVFTCGYGDAEDVPAPIVHAIKLLTGHLYENREETTALSLERLPLGVEALVSTYRNGVYG